MALTSTSIRRPVATTMFYLIIVTFGAVGLRYLAVDLLPRIEFPRLSVTVDYANVGPEEMETIVTDRLENALAMVGQQSVFRLHSLRPMRARDVWKTRKRPSPRA